MPTFHPAALLRDETKKVDFWKDLEQSLNRLQTDYIDVFQFHNPAFCPRPGDGTGLYEAALEAKAQGKIRHIGITNHKLPIAEEIIASGLYETLQFPFCYLATEKDIEITEKEISLIQRLAEFKNVLKEAASTYSPALIANYTYDLVKEYNQFYHDYSILREENEDKRAFRLLLSVNTAKIIRNGMKLLGIEMTNEEFDFLFCEQAQGKELKVVDGKVIAVEPKPQKLSYEQLVISKIREKYSIDQELAILRQRDIKPTEFAEYNSCVEQCKAEAKEVINGN